ncbi:hypothetical protein [Pendulispora albinea]|uniref:Uncharacterized protein n=1 Tax=Pendulispora albinea TaxID=2741071 RepID=A0ABZ2LYK4_9BACT
MRALRQMVRAWAGGAAMAGAIVGIACALGACATESVARNTTGVSSGADAGAPPPLDPVPAPQPGGEPSPAAACAPGAPTGKGAPIAKYDASACGSVPTVGAGTCPTEKIAFAQCKACENDGYVELCVESNDTATRCAIKAIAPQAEFHPGSAGRAQCDSAHQTLTMIPLDKSRDCPSARHEATTDSSWSRICALASLAKVKKIVPTFFE